MAPTTIPEPTVLPDQDTFTETVTDQKTKLLPPHAVILHNDDINGMDFVIGVLRKVFKYSSAKSISLMLKAHFYGRSIIWSGPLEVAEFKADQVKSCGPDPNMKHKGAAPLSVSVEPLP